MSPSIFTGEVVSEFFTGIDLSLIFLPFRVLLQIIK